MGKIWVDIRNTVFTQSIWVNSVDLHVYHTYECGVWSGSTLYATHIGDLDSNG